MHPFPQKASALETKAGPTYELMAITAIEFVGDVPDKDVPQIIASAKKV